MRQRLIGFSTVCMCAHLFVCVNGVQLYVLVSVWWHRLLVPPDYCIGTSLAFPDPPFTTLAKSGSGYTRLHRYYSIEEVPLNVYRSLFHNKLARHTTLCI